MLRTHTCGQLRSEHAGEKVQLAGWIATTRDHGNLLFVDLRDRYGKTQIVLDAALGYSAAQLKTESVIRVEGVVVRRGTERVNPKLATGEIEVHASGLEVLSASATPPLEILEDVDPGFELRMKHRYLDMRREKVRALFELRHRICKAIREFLDAERFLDIETPFLTRATPEGARDYLVPSRVNPGSFYALPQSPQLMKQVFMIAGFDRYYQIVRCFRDEDLRADRQPEFTQLDLEMSFVEEGDVMDLVERLVAHFVRTVHGVEIALPLPRISYDLALARYGSDAPDLRYELPIVDVVKAAAGCGFGVFENAAREGAVRAIRLPGGASRSRKEISQLEDHVKEFGAAGLAWIKLASEGPTGPPVKFLAAGALERIVTETGGAQGDLLLFVAGARRVVEQSLGKLRVRLGSQLDLTDPSPSSFAFCWVVEFPLLEFDEEAGRYKAAHHPFTSPRPEDLEMLEPDPGRVKARAYDLVLNGIELGGGSIRIHRRDVQNRVFTAIGLTLEQQQAQFGWFLEALTYGAPPHGGIALGIDRLVALMAGLDNIREVVAFPKTSKARCLFTGAPSRIEPPQLAELGIALAAGQVDTGPPGP